MVHHHIANSMQTIQNILQYGRQFLQKNSKNSNALLDATLLLMHVLQCDRASILAHPDTIVANNNIDKYQHYLTRRSQYEPIAYIIGKKEFYSLDFFVGAGVLIPRPLTEHIVDFILEKRPFHEEAYQIIDICTGSACIPISLLHYYPHSHAHIIDHSALALSYAKKNIKHHQMQNKISIYQQDVTHIPQKMITKWQQKSPHIITANPPYICQKTMKILPNDVKNYEPDIALNGGKNGMELWQSILPLIVKLSDNKPLIALECAQGQADNIQQYLYQHCPHIAPSNIYIIEAKPPDK